MVSWHSDVRYSIKSESHLNVMTSPMCDLTPIQGDTVNELGVNSLFPENKENKLRLFTFILISYIWNYPVSDNYSHVISNKNYTVTHVILFWRRCTCRSSRPGVFIYLFIRHTKWATCKYTGLKKTVQYGMLTENRQYAYAIVRTKIRKSMWLELTHILF